MSFGKVLLSPIACVWILFSSVTGYSKEPRVSDFHVCPVQPAIETTYDEPGSVETFKGDIKKERFKIVEVAKRSTDSTPGKETAQLLYVVEDSKGQFHVASGWGMTNAWKVRSADLAQDKPCSDSLKNSKFKSAYLKWLRHSKNSTTEMPRQQDASGDGAQ